MSALRTWWLRARFWMAEEEATTRPIGLVRMFAGCLLWTSYASDFLLWETLPGGNGPGLPPLQAAVAMLAGVLYLVGSTMLVFGWKSRLGAAIAAIALALCFFGLGELLGVKRFLHHHTELLTLTCVGLAIAPSGRSFSLDRWLAVRRARASGQSLPEERGPLNGQRMICLLVSSIYFWAAIDKMRAPYLNGHELERLFVYYFMDSERPDVPGFTTLMIVLAVSSVALELALAVGLWWTRSQKILMLGGIALHLTMFLTLNVGSFGTMMCLLYVLFFPPDRVQRFLDDVLAPSTERLDDAKFSD